MEKSWKLEKYGRFVQANDLNTQSQGKWQFFTKTPTKALVVSLKKPLNLVIQHGAEILESFNLIKTKEWIKAINKSDTIMFLCKSEEKIHRFRIKFYELDNCTNFVNSICKYVTVQRIEETTKKKSDGNHDKMEIENSQYSPSEPKIVTVKFIAQNILQKTHESIPQQYQTNKLSTDTETTQNLIKTCLLDPDFPSFVENVEKTLDGMV